MSNDADSDAAHQYTPRHKNTPITMNLAAHISLEHAL